jgi:Fe-S cluster biogenesis protein NfuA/nitrite reductase/ring-hydroxylating ferredoxin subunit
LPEDTVVSHLLLLHGLHPLPIEARVHQALEKVRPYMESHGGNVELVSVDDGVVRVRLQGTCGTCPASSITLKLAVEDAIHESAPDVIAVEEVKADVEVGADDTPFPLHLATPTGAAPEASSWYPIRGLDGLDQRGVRTERVDGHTVLFCRLGDDLFAYNSLCPVCEQSLDAAQVEGTALACPTCGQTYDVIRAGRGLDTPSKQLEPFPLLVEQNEVRIALPALANTR